MAGDALGSIAGTGAGVAVALDDGAAAEVAVFDVSAADRLALTERTALIAHAPPPAIAATNATTNSTSTARTPRDFLRRPLRVSAVSGPL